MLDHGTGLSQSTVQVALKGLLARNIIMATRRSSPERGFEPTTYRLHVLTPFTESRGREGTDSGVALPRELVRHGTRFQETAFAVRNSMVADAGESGAAPGDTGQARATAPSSTASPRPTHAAHTRVGGLSSLGDALRAHRLHTPGQSLASVSAVAPTPGSASDGERDGERKRLTAQIVVAVTEVAQEFGGLGHLRSNTTHALHLWQASRRSEAAFVSSLYEARAITRQQRHVARPIPYFWSVVRDLLHLSEGGAASQRPHNDAAMQGRDPGDPAAPVPAIEVPRRH